MCREAEMELLFQWSTANEFIADAVSPKPFTIKLGHAANEAGEEIQIAVFKEQKWNESKGV